MTFTTARRLVTALILAVAAILATASTSAAADKVGICHATNSATNPYVYIEVDDDAAKAHLDGTHPSHHGVTADDEDYLAEDPSACATHDGPSTEPTPSPSSSTPEPTASASTSPQATPTSSDSPTPTQTGSALTATTTPLATIPDTATERGDAPLLALGIGIFLVLVSVGGAVIEYTQRRG